MSDRALLPAEAAHVSGEPLADARALWRKRLLRFALLALLGFALLFCRAWPRLLHPEVWDEDGSFNLPQLASKGPASIFVPVNGYFIVLPKLITAAAAEISFVAYPLVSTALGWAVTIAIFCTVATAPVTLRGGALLAVASLLIPSDTETFGVPLYTFWWSGLLLFVLVFWSDASAPVFRATLLLLASLSGPLCLVVLPLFWVRAKRFHFARRELLLATLATLCAVGQAVSIILTSTRVPSELRPGRLPLIIPQFLGNYALGNLLPDLAWPAGLLVLAFLVWSLLRSRGPEVAMLTYLLLASILMTASRVDITYINPAFAGPRYFFYPFILLSWIFLHVAFTERRPAVTTATCLALLLSVANAIPVWFRTHDRLSWSRAAMSCPHFDEYELPVHWAGDRNIRWTANFTRSQCRSFLAHDVFYDPDPRLTLPFRESDAWSDRRAADLKLVTVDSKHVVTSWSETSFVNEHPGFVFFSSRGSRKPGFAAVRMKRGDALMFRSGPEAGGQTIDVEGAIFHPAAMDPRRNWTLLVFSSDLLPDEFTVRFRDESTSPGSWTAIGVRRTLDAENAP